MSEQINWSERRQFGRRPLNAEAIAELPGPVEIPCIIENLSEGGALLSFPTGVAPINLFALSIEDVPFKLRCEMRYQVGIRFGVRFMRVDQGEALVRHFFKSTAPNASTGLNTRSGLDRSTQPSSSIRQLREALLPLITPEATRAPEATDVAASRPMVIDHDMPAAEENSVASPTVTAQPKCQAPPLSSRPARLVARR